jgi:hypothetical protein
MTRGIFNISGSIQLRDLIADSANQKAMVDALCRMYHLSEVLH